MMHKDIKWKQTETPDNWKEWIASEDEISRQERLAYAIEEQAEATKRQTDMIEMLMMQTKRLAEAIEEQAYKEEPKDPITGWTLQESMASIAASLMQQQK